MIDQLVTHVLRGAVVAMLALLVWLGAVAGWWTLLVFGPAVAWKIVVLWPHLWPPRAVTGKTVRLYPLD